MTIAVDLGRKATKQTNKNNKSRLLFCHKTQDWCAYEILRQTSVLPEKDMNGTEHSQNFRPNKKGILKSVTVSAYRNWSRTEFSRSSQPLFYNYIQ